eukprot:281280-Pleurochrysis_carterae.AAC.2
MSGLCHIWLSSNHLSNRYPLLNECSCSCRYAPSGVSEHVLAKSAHLVDHSLHLLRRERPFLAIVVHSDACCATAAADTAEQQI